MMALTGNVSIKVENDHTEEVLTELKRKIEMSLEAIGGQAEKYAKMECPVDTGRLRNSITFATKKAQGSPNTSGGANATSADTAMHGRPDENTVVVGTNVEYAPEQEYYGRKKHFLRNAVTMHNDDYKKIVEAALKS